MAATQNDTNEATLNDDNKNESQSEDTNNPSTKQSTAQIQLKLQVQFTTKIADKSMQCDDTIYELTSQLKPQALSQVVNHILNKKSEDSQIDFDFLLDGKYITTSLAEHLSLNEISSEETLTIEYIEKTIEPSAKSTDQHPDWVSCVDALKNNLFITGCYDGIIRVWKPGMNKISQNNKKTDLFCQHRGHIAPIKGITALYSTKNIHYFSSVAKDRSVKVFALNEGTTEIKQVAKVDIKSDKHSHRFCVECCSAPFPSKVLATGSADREIKIYRLTNKDELDENQDDDGKENENREGPPNKKRKLNDMDNDKNKMEIDEDAVDGDGDNESKVEWSSLSNISTLRGHRDAIKCIDWSNPYALYSGSWDNCIKLWDVHKEIDSYTWSTQSGVSCIKYWNTQNVLISAHTNQKIAIWDPRTDVKLTNKTMSQMTFRSHRLPITGIDVDGMSGIDDGNENKVRNSDYLFVSCAHDGKLKIWDIRSHSPLYNIDKHKGKALCVGWYGSTIVSGGSDCKLHSFKWSNK